MFTRLNMELTRYITYKLHNYTYYKSSVCFRSTAAIKTSLESALSIDITSEGMSIYMYIRLSFKLTLTHLYSDLFLLWAQDSYKRNKIPPAARFNGIDITLLIIYMTSLGRLGANVHRHNLLRY